MGLGVGYRPGVLAFLLLGCLEPFPTDRHDLVDLRIVGMRADADGVLGAYVWDGAEAWSAAAPAREWGGDARCAVDCRLDGPGAAELTVTASSGATEAGSLDWGAGAAVAEPERPYVVVDGDVATLELEVPGAERVRWMAPAGELEEVASDTVEFTAPGEGVWPVVALWLDGEGGNGWTTLDVVVGVEGPFLAVGNRRFPFAAQLAAGPVRVQADVVSDPGLAGFALSNVLVDDGTALDAVCGDDGGVWDPDAVVERRCGLNDVLGARVRVDAEVLP